MTNQSSHVIINTVFLGMVGVVAVVNCLALYSAEQKLSINTQCADWLFAYWVSANPDLGVTLPASPRVVNYSQKVS